jgi:hypothetical protein
MLEVKYTVLLNLCSPVLILQKYGKIQILGHINKLKMNLMKPLTADEVQWILTIIQFRIFISPS